MFKAIEKLNKRHFCQAGSNLFFRFLRGSFYCTNTVEHSMKSACGAKMMSHKKTMYHKKNGNGDSDVRAMAIYLRYKQLNTMPYIYDRKGYDKATIYVLVRIDLFGLWFH